MKTQNTNLNIKKNSLIELNDEQLDNVKGGTQIPGTITTITIEIIFMTFQLNETIFSLKICRPKGVLDLFWTTFKIKAILS